MVPMFTLEEYDGMALDLRPRVPFPFLEASRLACIFSRLASPKTLRIALSINFFGFVLGT